MRLFCLSSGFCAYPVIFFGNSAKKRFFFVLLRLIFNRQTYAQIHSIFSTDCHVFGTDGCVTRPEHHLYGGFIIQY